MKTLQFIPYVLLAGTMMLGSACSSSTETTTGSTAGTGSTEATGTAGTGDTPGSSAAGAGTDGAGSASGGGTAGASGTPMGDAQNGGVSSSAATANGAGNPADQAAFMATFATMKDPAFLLTAASSNMLEIQSGQMAAQKATNPQVRSYAQTMVSHHTMATQQLKAVATPLGVTMPTTLIPVHQAMADRLMNASGKSFDETYMDLMERAHKMDVALFEVKSKAAETPAVQQFATKTLPMLREHQSMANKIEKKVD